jgi:site-specific DNA-methyltransferase (adenine-specific)
MMDINTIHNSDWMNNGLPDKSVDLIIADPPYFEILGDFDFIWDSFDDYLKDVEKWAIECKRVLKDNGTLFWYGDDKRIAYAQVIFDKHFNLLNNLVWHKGENFMGLNNSDELRSFAPCTERILMYSNDKYNLTQCIHTIRDYIRAEITKAKGKIVLKHVNEALGTATNGGGVASSCFSLNKTEPTMITKEMYQKLQTWCNPYLKKEYEELRKEYEELRKEYEELRRPFDNFLNINEVMRFNNESSLHTQYKHPTRKPTKLTRALMLTCSKPGALVLVPFAGSGTECAMAQKENRDFIGFEIDEKYHAVAMNRLKHQQEKSKQQSLF